MAGMLRPAVSGGETARALAVAGDCRPGDWRGTRARAVGGSVARADGLAQSGRSPTICQGTPPGSAVGERSGRRNEVCGVARHAACDSKFVNKPKEGRPTGVGLPDEYLLSSGVITGVCLSRSQ